MQNLETRAVKERAREPWKAFQARQRSMVVKREAVLRTEGQHHGVVVRRRLELEVERHAELLAQREAPRAVDPAAERRVDDELHAAAFVEKPLGDDRHQSSSMISGHSSA